MNIKTAVIDLEMLAHLIFTGLSKRINSPLEIMQHLIIFKNYFMDKYKITNSEIYDIEYYLWENLMTQRKHQKIMNEEIKKYPIFIINKQGQLKRIYNIKSTDDYNHYLHNLHHFIEYSQYTDNEQWYKDRQIEQKLILMSIPLHEQLHNQAIKVLSDAEFEKQYKISKYKLIFNKKYSEYKEIGER